MKWALWLAAGLVAPSAATAADYDCLLGEAYSVGPDKDGNVVARPISFGGGLGETEWRFTLRRDEREAEVVWRNSPMQLAGKSPLIQTSEASFAAFYVGRGPCLFTEGHCGATVHFAEQPDGTLKLRLYPIALSSFEDGHREPFTVYLAGRCDPKDDDQ